MKFDKQFDRRKVLAGLLIGAGAVLVYCLFTNLNAVAGFLNTALNYVSPVTWGLLLAYVMLPMAKKLEKWTPKFIKSPKARLHIGTLGAFIILIIIILLVMYMLIPQLLVSATTFVSNIDRYLASVQEIIETYADKLGIESPIAELYDLDSSNIIKRVSTWFTENLAYVANTVVNFGSYTMNFIIVLMIALYALLDRHNIKRGVQRIEYAVMGQKRTDRFNEIIARGDSIMMKFLTSNLLDALIIGVVNFIFLGIVKAPYQVLMAVFLGVTNFIPTFGPIIGAAVVGITLLIIDPSIFIVTMIFTFILQQIDGNVIKPLLFGDSTGLSPFWVLVAIVVGGRVFGILGMITGVPVVALLRTIMHEVLEKRIKARDAEPAEAQEKEETA